MKTLLTMLVLGSLAAAPVSADAASPAPPVKVHITLHATATVGGGVDGMFVLGSIADIAGGDPAMRGRMAMAEMGRMPLPGCIRLFTQGDVLLKLRQAGIDPTRAALVDGSEQSVIATSAQAVSAAVPGAVAPIDPATGKPAAAPAVCVHRGDTVTIVIQDGPINISALGMAQEDGAVGDMIRVHRQGCMQDLNVTVLGSQTVRLEIQ